VRILRFLALIVFAIPSILVAQNASPAAQAIRAVLDRQAVDWNRGDLDAFAAGYKNSPDILFMGPTISRGYAQMLDRYRKGYSTKEKMGTLSFTGIEVQPLDERFATVTGDFHLERTSAGGGNADGYFLLVVEKTTAGWKIIRDATTGLPKKTAQ
jgi:ketosteroid isomerase-like protein